MREREVLLWLNDSLGRARYGAYVLSEIDDRLGQEIEGHLQAVAALMKSRLLRVARTAPPPPPPAYSASATLS